ncbi:thioredoxin domain-containing protein [Hoyosella rhizosphaerae]|uniref:Thioredoxin-like fold domain-containing protein n=1 Tax=Hoyosella rhizosphaerae TaxID=1755582 RepID=A0A916U8Q2_9ACTN|nr:thioredoxin domain-containing protein [Hoyosella rhizosphaerae]MBN4927717.1 thioredoxin domain-containing protein [Hoyosella rhizosphaerae]GGC62151.1 hypothetical protein GCM10011410_13260 [Hoyosella rhizosphaerae]
MSQRPKPGFVTQQTVRDQRRATIIRVVITAIVVVVGVAGVMFVLSQRGNDTDDTNSEITQPPSDAFVDGAGIAFGATDGPVRIDVYEDYLCPACAAFEELSGETLRDLADSEQATVVYHPITILDSRSPTQYSSRAASASVCVAEYNKDVWPAFQEGMYADQPQDLGARMSNSDIADFAASLGADSDELRECITDATYQGFVIQNTNELSQQGINQTPTVHVNGEKLEDVTPAGILAAVSAATE